MSSCAAASYCSVVFVSGQTRISSSFGSTRAGPASCSCGSLMTSSPAPLLQCIAAAAAGGELHLGERHEHVGAALQIVGLEQRLLLFRPIGAHDAQRVDEELARSALNRRPVGLQLVGVEIGPQHAQKIAAIDLVLAEPLVEVGGKAVVADGCH